MEEQIVQFQYQVYESIQELELDDRLLLEAAQQATQHAYAPYSNFRVGAAVRLLNKELVIGSNQENASFPVGICAERVALSTVSSVHPGETISSMAVSYQSESNKSNTPISPCGICRQTLSEAQQRQKSPIRLILGGMTGRVYVISNAGNLLPLVFTGEEL